MAPIVTQKETTCDACGQALAIGDYPFCPHGRSTLSAHPDDVPGGFLAENGFPTPRRFDSKSAHRAALADACLEIRAKWAGEHDRYLTRWDTVDLDGAAQLVSRGTQARQARIAARADAVITVTDGSSFSAKDLADDTATD